MGPPPRYLSTTSASRRQTYRGGTPARGLMLDRKLLVSRDRARQRYEAALCPPIVEEEPLDEAAPPPQEEPPQVKPNALRLLRRYQTLSDETNPRKVASRMAASEAAKDADKRIAARVAVRTVTENEERWKARLLELELKRFVCVPTPLNLRCTFDDAEKDAEAKPVHRSSLSSLEAELESDPMRLTFEGTVGRLRFFEDYRHAVKLRGLTTDMSMVLGSGTGDPRWIARDFFREALNRGATAPSTAILRRAADGTLNLRGLGLNDGVVLATAKVMPRLRFLRQIDLAENAQVSDGALAEFCNAIQKSVPGLDVLDLSKNKIGPRAAKAIRDLLASGHRLSILRLEAADVDEYECAELTKSIAGNRSLKELHLGRNFIGQLEERNVLNNPNILTGAESIAKSFQGGHMALETLDLSWNFVRKESAIALAKALRNLDSLTDLRLAHNCFGDEPTQYLAAALHKNYRLRYLDLSFNAVAVNAAMVLSTMIKINGALVSLKLDGNPLGSRGAAALVAALQSRGAISETGIERDPLHISLRQCDTTVAGPRLFDKEEPQGTYHLDLTKPFDRMIALELVNLATTRDHCAFTKITYFPPKQKKRDIKLHRGGQDDNAAKNRRSSYSFLERRRGQKPSWTLILARTIAQHYVARDDLDSVLKWLGFELNEYDINKVLQDLEQSLETEYYDDDEASRYTTTTDSTETTRPTEDDNRHPVLNRRRFMRYLLHGIFVLADSNANGCISKTELQELLHLIGLDLPKVVVSRCVAQFDTDDSGVFEEEEFMAFAQSSFVEERREAKAPLCVMDDKKATAWRVPEDGILDVVFAAEPTLPSEDQLGTDVGVAAFVSLLQKTTSEQERTLLFDLATEQNQGDLYLTCEQARRVYEAAARTPYSPVEKVAKLLPLIVSAKDSSTFVETHLSPEQKVMLKNKVGSALFALLVGNATGHYALNFRNLDDRVAARKLAGIATAERAAATKVAASDTSQHGNGWNFRNERFNGRPITLTPSWFTNLDEKIGTLEFDYVATMRPSKAAIAMSPRRYRGLLRLLNLANDDDDSCSLPSVPPVPQQTTPEMNENEEDQQPVIKELDPVAMEWREWMTSSRDRITPSFYSEIYELESKGFMAQGAELRKKFGHLPAGSGSQRRLSKGDSRRSSLTADPNPTPLYRDYARRVHALKANMGHHHFSTALVLDLVQRFPPEQTVRVELCVAVFGRIVDVRNFSNVVDALTEAEQLELYHRLGYLNVLNSADVDRRYEMNLKVPDERKMASILVNLAIAEPGENWVDESFRRKESLHPSPGWQLPLEWHSDEVIHYGILGLTYSSTGRGCKPDPAVRRGLLPTFLCGWPDDDEFDEFDE